MEIHDLTQSHHSPRPWVGNPWVPRQNPRGMTGFLVSVICCFLILPAALDAAVPDGYIVKVDSATVYLDWGKSSGVQAGDQFKVYRAGEPLKHPVTGEVLGQTEVDLAAGVIEHPDEKFSTGHLVSVKSDVKAGDRSRLIE